MDQENIETTTTENVEPIVEDTTTETTIGEVGEQKQGGEATENILESGTPADAKKPTEKHDVRRMQKFMEKAAKAEAERDAYKALLESQGKPIPRQQPENSVPKKSDFENEDEFIAAMVDHRLSQRLPQESAKAAAQAIQATFQQKEAAFKKVAPDYDEVIADAGNVSVPNFVADAVVKSAIGPNIRYYLAQNPDIAAELCSLPPDEAIDKFAEIRKTIKSEIEAKFKPPAKKISNAPEPIKPLKTTEKPVETDINKLPFDEYVKRKNEADRKAGRPI
jgi:hypothetical protein